MTKEEAIKEMIRAYDVLDFSSHMDNRRKEAFNMAKEALEQQPCEDAIPRTTAITLVNDVQINCGFSDYEYYEYLYDHLSTLPSVNPQPKTDCNKCVYSTKNGECQYDDIAETIPTEQEPKTGHCKDCKYFEYDSVARVDGIPLIVAHEICSRWGDGCKTKEGGYCFLFEPQESEVSK